MEHAQQQILETIVTEVPTTAETISHSITDILTNLGLHDYVATFNNKGYTDVQDLQDMSKDTNKKEWDILISDTGLKPRHAVRLQRRLQIISSEQAKIKQTMNSERMTDIVKGWNEKQVWQWLMSKSYGAKLSISAWEYTNGPTLLELTYESAKELKVHTILIPQLLQDITSLVNESETIVNTTGDESTLIEHLEEIKELENRLTAMDYRARVKELGKEFEGSLIRVFCIMLLTYAVLSVYMLLINVDRPWTSAIIPTMGFQLSTLPLPSIKACYVEHRMKSISA